MLVVAGTFGPPAAADDHKAAFQGVAALCAVDPSGVTTETRGGITDTLNLLMYFRIETDHPLVNGHEELVSNSRLNAKENGFYWGYGTVYPDMTPGSTLEGAFVFSTNKSPVKGTYKGTGDLEGVTMAYQLVPTALSPDDPICGGTPPLFGYLMSGTVRNFKGDGD
jgi:hypothetical protein